MINILSVDVEDRIQAPSKPVENSRLFNFDEISKSITLLLDLFKEFNAKATFFISCIIAEKIPDTVREIFNQGHEIATHGYNHNLVYNLTEKEFEKDLVKSLDTLTVITGTRPIGYRAPYWSITKTSLWALKILQKNGIKYDSSIFPIKNYLYGIPEFPRFPHYIEEFSIFEFPGSTINIFGRNIPFGGGFYLRALPVWFTKLCMKAINKRGYPSLTYFHQHELSKDRYPLSFWHKENFILNFGRKSLARKIKTLLLKNNFISFKDCIGTSIRSQAKYGYSNNK